ncbi:MAG: helix-turn-helix transcriptional regulator, partial [Solirubrobacteraceae bacterium]|nr:helix-turn-helix transcriptional regulator [Solirubrobacteraceae bacterium]
MSSSESPALDHRIVKALAHPLRQNILTILNERVASPSEISEELDERLGNVSYHVRTLLDLGCIELVSTTPRRGAVEHHYRAVMKPFFSNDDWAQMPASTRRSAYDTTLKAIVKDVVATAEANGFDTPEDLVSRITGDLDAKGRADLAKLLTATKDKAEKIFADSNKRLGGSSDGTSSEVALIGFATATAGAAAKKPAKKPAAKAKKAPARKA